VATSFQGKNAFPPFGLAFRLHLRVLASSSEASVGLAFGPSKPYLAFVAFNPFGWIVVGVFGTGLLTFSCN
jgi:hypothetical protein